MEGVCWFSLDIFRGFLPFPPQEGIFKAIRVRPLELAARAAGIRAIRPR